MIKFVRFSEFYVDYTQYSMISGLRRKSATVAWTGLIGKMAIEDQYTSSLASMPGLYTVYIVRVASNTLSINFLQCIFSAAVISAVWLR